MELKQSYQESELAIRFDSLSDQSRALIRINETLPLNDESNVLSDFRPDFKREWFNEVLSSNQSVFGPLERDKEEAVRKGVRNRSWSEVLDGWYASSTINVPNLHGALFALWTRTQMQDYSSEALNDPNKYEVACIKLHDLMMNVVTNLSENLISQYSLNASNHEIMFEENATTALFNFLNLVPQGDKAKYLTFCDTGRPVPSAMLHNDPKSLLNNFAGTMRIGHYEEKPLVKPEVELYLVSHYANGGFRDDKELIEEITKYVSNEKPNVILIPTLTRTGRIVPFQKIGEIVRKLNQEGKTSTLCILDDAQGFGRLDKGLYKDIDNYADAILGTGAKVIGALSGTGFIITRKGLISESSNLDSMIDALRLKMYGYYTGDHSTLGNVYSKLKRQGAIHSVPELASFSAALPDYFSKVNETTKIRVEALRAKIVESLKQNKNITVFDYSNIGLDPSIVAFDVKGISPFEFKKSVQEPDGDLTITLPALITIDEHRIVKEQADFSGHEENMKHSLRISIDPYRIESQEKNCDLLLNKINSVLEVIG